jgi:hypothetical protein
VLANRLDQRGGVRGPTAAAVEVAEEEEELRFERQALDAG